MADPKPQPNPESARARRRRNARRPLMFIWILGGLVVVAGVMLTLKYTEPPPPRTITLAGGAPGGAYHAFAQEYRERLEKEGVTLEVVDTVGSVENLELLIEGKADVAFVQSGTRSAVDADAPLRGIASLYYEPLWIFYTGEGSIDRLTEFAGKRLGIGPPRSGTNAVVRQLLELNGLSESDVQLHEMPIVESKDALLRGDLDAAFFVSSPEAAAIRELIESPETRLVDIKRYRAYVRNVLFVKELEIAEGMLDLRRNIPFRDIVALSTLATMVCHEDMHPAMVELLVRVASDLHSGGRLFERGGEFPTPDYLEFPIHEAASDYFRSGPSLLARYLPFWLAGLVKRLLVLAIPLITLMIPLFKLAPVIYRAVMRKRIHKWYEALEDIEERVAQAKSDEDRARAADELRQLAREVEAGIEVPTSFRHDEYDLRMHIEFMRKQIGAA